MNLNAQMFISNMCCYFYALLFLSYKYLSLSESLIVHIISYYIESLLYMCVYIQGTVCIYSRALP